MGLETQMRGVQLDEYPELFLKTDLESNYKDENLTLKLDPIVLKTKYSQFNLGLLSKIADLDLSLAPEEIIERLNSSIENK